MGKNKNKRKGEPAVEEMAKATTEATTGTVEVPAEESEGEGEGDTPSKTWEMLSKNYVENANRVLRMVNFHYGRRLVKEFGWPKADQGEGAENVGQKYPEKMETWADYCDMKIEAFRSCWEAKKTNPQAGKSIRAIEDPEKLKAKEEEYTKLLARVERAKKVLELSKPKKKEAAAE